MGHMSVKDALKAAIANPGYAIDTELHLEDRILNGSVPSELRDLLFSPYRNFVPYLSDQEIKTGTDIADIEASTTSPTSTVIVVIAVIAITSVVAAAAASDKGQMLEIDGIEKFDPLVADIRTTVGSERTDAIKALVYELTPDA